MSFTKGQLDSMNKTQLVDLTLVLDAQVEASKSKPLTAGELERRLLDLGEKSISVNKEVAQVQAEYKERLASIKAESDKAIKKLELEYDSNKGKSASELLDIYKELEERAEKAKDDLSYGLKTAEIEFNDKMAEIATRLEAEQARVDALIAESNEELEVTKSSNSEAIVRISTQHKRDLEQLEYDHKLAIRDEKLSVAEEIAAVYEKVLINESELERLEAHVNKEAESIDGAIEAAVKAESTKIYSSEGAKYSKLKSETDSAIALLQNDKKHLEANVASQLARIADLEARLKDVPAQIAAAVEAAKTSTTVNQTSGK